MRFDAAALPFLASGVGAEFVLQVRSFQPPPSAARAAVGRAFDEAHNACLVDVEENGLCRPRDPFEAIFGGSGPSSLRSIFDSDPFFRDDPFIRLAATPPSASRSSSLLDEVFPQVLTRPVQVSRVEDNVGSLFDVLDGMMDSAMRMALSPPPQMQRISIAFGPDEEENDSSAPKSPADAAVSLLDCMVDGLLDHAASASASASNDVDEDQETEPANDVEDAIAREESERQDVLHARSGRSRPSNDDGQEAARYVPEAPAVETEATPAKPFHPVWDRVALARKIAQHGRDVLADEEKVNKAGADGDLRRRLSEEDEVKSDVRRRMARRLTEVVPFGHLSLVPMMMPPPMITVMSEAEQVLPPRLGFGSQTDRCLWSLYQEEEGISLSRGCANALDAVGQSLVDLKKEEMGFVQSASGVPAQDRGIGYRFAEFVQTNLSSFFVFWVSIVMVLLTFSCFFGDDDEDAENEEYGDAADYVLVEDTDDESDEHHAPDTDDESDKDHAPEGDVACVGVPVSVV